MTTVFQKGLNHLHAPGRTCLAQASWGSGGPGWGRSCGEEDGAFEASVAGGWYPELSRSPGVRREWNLSVPVGTGLLGDRAAWPRSRLCSLCCLLSKAPLVSAASLYLAADT